MHGHEMWFYATREVPGRGLETANGTDASAAGNPVTRAMHELTQS